MYKWTTSRAQAKPSANSDAATATPPAPATPPATVAPASAAEPASATARDDTASTLVLCINGTIVELGGATGKAVDPSISLNDYIRRFTPLKGTKLSCGEGGCGACAVMLSRVDPFTGKVVHKSVNSCLCPLASLDGW